MKLFTLFTIFTFAANFLFAQPGSLDHSFNDSGKVVNSNFGVARATVVQDDGKIIVGGEISEIGFHAFTIARYTIDGVLDASFGNKGIIDPEFYAAGIYSLLLYKNGKILASGYGTDLPDNSPYFSPLLAQYLPDGTLDQSFGNDGKVALDLSTVKGTYMKAMGVMEDGRIVQAGKNGYGKITVIRYMPDGSLDKNFGNAGIAFIDIYIWNINALALQPDGKIILGGEYSRYSTGNFFMTRLNTDGGIDSSFGFNGRRSIDFFGNEDIITSLALQPDGKILATGSVDNNGLLTPVMTLVRFKPDGFFDSSFGDNGKAYADFGKMQSGANSIALQSDGKINIAGFAKTVTDTSLVNLLFGLAQFNADGSINKAFGENGVISTDFGYRQQANAISLQADGKIVVAGTANPGYDTIPYNYLALARYNNDGTPVSKKIKKLLRWAYNHNNGVALNWPGEGGGYYVVQRTANYSVTGTTATWANIARLQANAGGTYSYTDNNPSAGTNYYRVQQVSAAGSTETSNVIAVTANADAAISVSPNPVQNVLHIQGLNATTKYSLQVVNAQGNTLAKANANKVAAFNLNIQQLNKGIYYLNVNGNNKTTAIKFVKE